MKSIHTYNHACVNRPVHWLRVVPEAGELEVEEAASGEESLAGPHPDPGHQPPPLEHPLEGGHVVGVEVDRVLAGDGAVAVDVAVQSAAPGQEPPALALQLAVPTPGHSRD